MESPINSAPQPAHKPSQAPEAFLTHSIFSERNETDSGQSVDSYVLTFTSALTRMVLASHRNLVPLGGL